MGIRSKISGSDFAVAAHVGYVKGGFGVVAIRQPGRTYQMPEWMGNDAKVGKFIHKMFPKAGKFSKKCQCDPCSFPKYRLDRHSCRCRWCRDTVQASIWATVIVRWLRMGHTDTRIEMEHHWKKGTVGSIVQKMRRVMRGERQDGVTRTGKPRGRPKKPRLDPIIPDYVESIMFTNI